MESFLPSEIARLVLGYLEDQKCDEAYSTFLKTSIHLEECLRMKEDGRKFRTQVLGLSLLDILYEYSAIYSLVQERLKKVDPEAVERLRHSGTLLDKITFLLNSTSSGQTMLFSISLPPGNSPQTSTVAHAHVRKRLRTSSSNDKRKDVSRKNFKANDISIIEANSNVHNLETTNLSSLPGNSIQNINLTGQENDIIRTPKRKIPSNNNKRQSRANSVVPEELEENFDITALTQALLDNHELHEKIAENINKVICTPEINTNISVVQDACSALNPTPDTNTTVQNPNNFTMELDNVIKKIVHDTESDPIFENFLHEVVCPPGQEETSDDYDDRGISNTSTPSNKSEPETVKKQTVKNRNRSAKLKRANSPVNITNSIDDHNAVAIESIISINAPESENISSAVPTTTEIIKNIENVSTTTTVSTIIPTISTVNNAAAIVSESTAINLNPSVSAVLPTTTVSNQNLTVDTSVPTNITNIEPSVLNNPNKNVLMLGHQQHQQQQQQPTFVIADSFPSIYQQPTIMPDNRIIFLSNKTPAIGSQFLTMPSTFQISQPAAVIADDIINMPTVFISDDPKTSSGYIISQPTCKRPRPVRKPLNKPKPARVSPRKILQRNDNSTSNDLESTVTTQETEIIKYTISIQAEPKQSKETTEEIAPSTSGLTSSPKKDALMEKNTTTPEKTKSTSSSKLQLSLSSPRSNKSHIRALDFSTPPKENQSSPRVASTSPKSQQKDKQNKLSKSPKAQQKDKQNKLSKSPKAQQKDKQNKLSKSPKAVKKLSTALFVSPLKSRKLPIATKSPKVKLKGDWNEDLIVANKKTDTDKHKKSPKLNQSDPEKDLNVDKKQENMEGVPCECTIKPAVKKLTSWDHELRSLIVPVPSTSEPKKTPAKKRTRTSQRNKDKKDKKPPNANTTEIEVLSIEAELAKMEGIEPENPLPVEVIIEEDIENEIVAEESESKITKSQPEKRKKQNCKSKTAAVQMVELNIREETVHITPEKIEMEKSEDNNTSNQDPNKSLPADSMRNMTPKIRKKCNTSNSSKKTLTNPDETKPKTAENKTTNQIAEAKEMTILSPSNMDKNASKTSLVEQAAKDDLQTEKEDCLPPTKEESKSLASIITPNIVKASCSNEVTAKRNLIPVLETPMKDDSLLLPITPRLFTPFNLDSPLTRLLGEKMNTGDLVPFLSPSFPMTPSFPITPNLQTGDTQSSYASRPTDYSNSSSYYQPSDSEQNQKLEQVLIDEAMKIETSDLKSKHLKTSTPCKASDSSESSSSAPIVANSEAGVVAKVRLSGSLLEQSNTSKKSTNTSQSSLDSTVSSSTLSSSLSSSDDTAENITKNEANVTVIHAVPDKDPNKIENKDKLFNKTPSKELYVRLIKTPILKKADTSDDNVKEDTTSENKISKEPIKRPRGRPKSPLKRLNKATTSNVPRRPGRPRKVDLKQDEEETIEKHRELKSKVTGSHVMLLKELEEKRIRIITELETTKPSKAPKRKLTKENVKNNIKGRLRVTRANANKIESIKKQETNKTVPVKLESNAPGALAIPRKSKAPQKIELVAPKLLKDKKCDAINENEIIAANTELNQSSISSPMYSVGSPNVSVSTIGHDDGLISYTPDEEIPRLHISSDDETIDDTLNESKTTQNKINDSDLLVKELKERGIYLIPNKDKKSEQLGKEKLEEETKPIQTENNEDKSAEQLKPVISSSTKEKSDKIEIMSDIHLDKSKVIDVSKIELSQGIITDVISRTSAKNIETIQENVVTKETALENVVTKETAQENVVTKETTQENTATNKNVSSTKEIVNNSDSTLDVSESSDYDFHVKVINEDSPEFFNITYSETSKTQKNMSDYNFTVLERNISAKIYIEEFDSWEDKTFTVTPYTNIYTILPKRKTKVPPTADNNATKTTDSHKNKKLSKPSETIPKAIDTNKSETKSKIVEPNKSETKLKTLDSNKSETKLKTLDSNKSETKLKTDAKKSDTKLKTVDSHKSETKLKIDTKKTETKLKTIDSNKSETKLKTDTKKTETKLKTVDSKKSETKFKTVDSKKSETKSKTSLKPLEILYNECVDESSTDTIITIKESEPKMKLVKSNNENDKKITSNKSSVKKIISLEQYKINKNKDSKIVQKTKDEINLEHVEVIETSMDEDLMNFALTVPNKDSNNQELNTKKRKAAEESLKQNIEKRMKPNDKHALLKALDVDSFLTKVHGPSEKS